MEILHDMCLAVPSGSRNPTGLQFLGTQLTGYLASPFPASTYCGQLKAGESRL